MGVFPDVGPLFLATEAFITPHADYVYFRTRLRSQLNPKSRLLKDFHTLPLASQIGLIVTD